MASGKSMSRVIGDIYSYSCLVSRDFAGANFRVTAKSPRARFDSVGPPKRQAAHTAPLAAVRTWVSAGSISQGRSISQGLEESQQLFLLRFTQIAESPDDMFSLAFVPLDGVLQRE